MGPKAPKGSLRIVEPSPIIFQICLRWVREIKHILRNGGFMMIYHGRIHKTWPTKQNKSHVASTRSGIGVSTRETFQHIYMFQHVSKKSPSTTSFFQTSSKFTHLFWNSWHHMSFLVKPVGFLPPVGFHSHRFSPKKENPARRHLSESVRSAASQSWSLGQTWKWNPGGWHKPMEHTDLVGGFNPPSLKKISQNGNHPQVGVKIKNIWKHHLVIGS